MTPSLGERLKLLVKETGKEQQEIAAEFGIKPSTFNGYILNKREPSIERLKQFADFFKVSIDFLLGYSDRRNPYLLDLPEDLMDFVCEEENQFYLGMAKEIKEKAALKEKRERA